ncbi:MAG: succinate dehydrogenase, cytochrome b556 subunit [Rhodospirillales bacterium]
MAQKPRSRARPLSPHLQIYRPQITSVLSIMHRFTGLGLVGGALILAYWVCAAAYGPETFHTAQAVLGSWFGLLVLLGLTFSLFYHLANGVRHLAWDAGWGFDLPVLRKTGLAVVGFSVIMTGLTFAVGLLMRAG